MKPKHVFFLLLACVLLLSSCGSTLTPETEATAASTATETAPEPTEPELPSLSGSVALSGDLRPDTDVTAKASLDQTGVSLVYEWYLDGEKLAGAAQKTLRLPVRSAGKSVKCRVFAEEGKFAGFVESEEKTVSGEASSPYSMAGLFYDVKVIGRCAAVKSAMAVDWSASGFEARVNSRGGAFTLSVKCDTGLFFVTSVDGNEERVYLPQGTSDLALAVPAGEHTVRVIRDTGVSTSSSTQFLSLAFDGEVLERPADKALYIEYIGDSICCGSGSLGKYVSGEAWKLADHSATHAFSYLSAKLLDADYSLVARGGIGLLAESGSHTMPAIYTRTCGFRSMTEEYDFASARRPDLIVLELGANDGSAYTDDQYYKALSDFVRLLREKWGDGVPIVWTGRSENHYHSMLSLIRARRSDADLYAFRYVYGGSGAAALTTQKAGHPSAAEQQEFANALVSFLKENSLV